MQLNLLNQFLKSLQKYSKNENRQIVKFLKPNRTQKIHNFIVSFVIIFSVLLSSIYIQQPIEVLAQNSALIQELQEKIDQRNRLIQDLEKEIGKYQNQITETSEKTKTLQSAIAELNATISKLLFG